MKFNEINNLNYNYTDNKPSGSDLYRIKIIEKNGSVTYSKIIHLKNSLVKEFAYNLYPNPTKSTLNLNFGSATTSKIDVSIVDVIGKVLLSKTYDVKLGANIVTLDVAALVDGNYYFKYMDVTTKSQGTFKFTKTK